MQLVKGLPIGYEPRGIEFTPDGNFAYVISVKSPNSLPTGVVSIIDVQSKEIIKELYLETNIKPFGIAIGPGRCGGDLDNDGDVDGTDLSIIAQGENNISVQYFAGDFARIGCD